MKNIILNSQILILIVLLFTPWTWYIAEKNLFITFVLILYSLFLTKVLFSSLDSTANKVLTLIKTLTLILFLVLAFYILITGFDKNIWQTSVIDIPKQENRHKFYAASFGKLYANKLGIYYYNKVSPTLTKIQSNLFSNLDINNYFFASNPRERAMVSEFEKYSFVFLSFFFYGLYFVFKKKIYFLGLLFLISILISGFVNQNYFLGPILFLPLINAVIVVGLFYSIKNIFPNKSKRNV